MNKVILIGRLSKDPELRYTVEGNVPVCMSTIAVPKKFKSENQPEADFIPLVAWRGTAEFISKYFTKGNRIAIVGSLQSRSWVDESNQKRYITEVVVDEAEFVESKKQAGASEPVPDDGYIPIDAGASNYFY